MGRRTDSFARIGVNVRLRIGRKRLLVVGIVQSGDRAVIVLPADKLIAELTELDVLGLVLEQVLLEVGKFFERSVQLTARRSPGAVLGDFA